MKKLFCISFFLFATTLSFSATTSSADKLANRSESGFVLPTVTSDLPMPVIGCRDLPQYCPDPPKPPVQ